MMFQSAWWDGTNMTLQQFSIVSFSRETECHNLKTHHSWSLQVDGCFFHESWDHVGMVKTIYLFKSDRLKQIQRNIQSKKCRKSGNCEVEGCHRSSMIVPHH